MKHLKPVYLSIFLLVIASGCGPVTPMPPTSTPLKLQDFAYQLAWSLDDKLLAASTNNGLFLLDTKTYKQVAAFSKVIAYDMAFGNQLMAASDGQIVRVWNLQDYRQIFETKGDVINFQSIAISRDDKILATGEQKRFRLWSLPDGALLADIPVKGFVSNLAFDEKNQLTVIIQYQAVIQTWDVAAKKMLTSFEIPRDVIFFTLGHDAKTVLLDFNDYGFERWDIPSQKAQHTYKEAIGASGFTRLSGDSRFAVIWGYNLDGDKNGLSVWDLTTDSRTHEYVTPIINGDGWRCGALSSDGATLAASTNEGFIFFYTAASGEKNGAFYLPYTFEVR